MFFYIVCTIITVICEKVNALVIACISILLLDLINVSIVLFNIVLYSTLDKLM